MTVNAVITAIKHARRVIKEWDFVGKHMTDISWREDQTRYAIIDPIIRALGWKIEDPKQCHPDYPQTANDGRVDYALFPSLDLQPLVDGRLPPPNIIIEAKSRETNLREGHISTLQNYVKGPPPMAKGVAVLTNGDRWWIYELQGSNALRRAPMVPVRIWDEGARKCAASLHQLLGHERWT